MPGIGGSLGECALCGQSFAMEVILHKAVPSFKVKGCNQTFVAHEMCIKAFEGKTVLELPEKSVLRRAYIEQNNPKADNE